MLSNTITERALELIANNPTIDIIEAVKEAILEENKIICELYENRTERAKNLNSLMYQKVYNKIIKYGNNTKTKKGKKHQGALYST
jgi:hypothetical protein